MFTNKRGLVALSCLSICIYQDASNRFLLKFVNAYRLWLKSNKSNILYMYGLCPFWYLTVISLYNWDCVCFLWGTSWSSRNNLASNTVANFSKRFEIKVVTLPTFDNWWFIINLLLRNIHLTICFKILSITARSDNRVNFLEVLHPADMSWLVFLPLYQHLE
jgi:hypothetical protein